MVVDNEFLYQMLKNYIGAQHGEPKYLLINPIDYDNLKREHIKDVGYYYYNGKTKKWRDIKLIRSLDIEENKPIFSN